MKVVLPRIEIDFSKIKKYVLGGFALVIALSGIFNYVFKDKGPDVLKQEADAAKQIVDTIDKGEETNGKERKDGNVIEVDAGADCDGSDRLDLNKCSKEELQGLSGIGPSKAEAIIEYRNTFGNFKSTEEIMDVKGVGVSIYNKVKDKIYVSTK